MKIKSGFAKRSIAGTNIVVPVGDKSKEFNGMITLNDSAAFFWDCFNERDRSVDEAVEMVIDEYDIDEKTAKKDIEDFVAMLKKNDLIDK